jgi:sugar phosphate isomerase/epimerase
MRLAGILATPDVQSAERAFWTGSLEEKISKAKEMGFHGVELLVRDPALLDEARLRSTLRSHELEVPQIVTGDLYGSEGLCVITPSKDTYAKALSRLDAIFGLAAEYGAYVNIGSFRGRIDQMESPEIGRRVALERLREVGERAAAAGVKITLEPANRFEVDFIFNAQDGLALLDELQQENVGLMLDLFHMNIEDAHIERSLEQAFEKGVLWHIHVADSNRRYPGSGHLDFRSILATLRRIGYKGFLSGEMLPIPDPDTAARETASYLLPLMGVSKAMTA